MASMFTVKGEEKDGGGRLTFNCLGLDITHVPLLRYPWPSWPPGLHLTIREAGNVGHQCWTFWEWMCLCHVISQSTPSYGCAISIFNEFFTVGHYGNFQFLYVINNAQGERRTPTVYAHFWLLQDNFLEINYLSKGGLLTFAIVIVNLGRFRHPFLPIPQGIFGNGWKHFCCHNLG